MSKTASIGTTEGTREEQETVTEAVVHAVAEQRGVSPLDLDPIATVIDPDALNALFREGLSGVRIEFEYSGSLVAVADGDVVSVTPVQP